MKPARKLLIVFLAVALIPTAVAGWLAWRLIEQDRAMAQQRLREILEERGDEVVQNLARELASLEASAGKLPAGTVTALDEMLAYNPDAARLPEAPTRVFFSGETAEFRNERPEEAARLYRELTSSPDAAVRAGAWLRLGRVLRKAGQRDEALRAYQELGKIANAAIDKVPAPIAALWAICAIRDELGDKPGLKRDGAALRSLLDSSRIALSRDVYETYADDAARWSGEPRPVTREALADAAASRPSGRGAAIFRDRLITWLVIDQRTILLTPDRTGRLLNGAKTRVRLAAQPGQNETLRRAEDSRLPWTLAIALRDPEAERQQFALRRRLLFGLLGIVIVLGAAGSYLAWRMIRRELALAQMQADIVAAVSHEFRTPLTTMRQVSAALTEGRIIDEERKRSYYGVLTRATERLYRLVEELLDFGRMESGAMPYRMESLNLTTLVAGVKDDFGREAGDRGVLLHGEFPTGAVIVRGDAEALGRALWNLLDNAVKYSGERCEIRVKLFRNGSGASLSVQDRGVGIPAHEQHQVFRKFFRGAVSREQRIRGTGIGLAMVDHIVRAHGGHIELESRPGDGSTFTIHLPNQIEEQNGANSRG